MPRKRCRVFQCVYTPYKLSNVIEASAVAFASARNTFSYACKPSHTHTQTLTDTNFIGLPHTSIVNNLRFQWIFSSDNCIWCRWEIGLNPIIVANHIGWIFRFPFYQTFNFISVLLLCMWLTVGRAIPFSSTRIRCVCVCVSMANHVPTVKRIECRDVDMHAKQCFWQLHCKPGIGSMA